MTTLQTETAAPPLTPIQWLICAIAAIGFAFDSYELLMLPLIVRPALADLLGAPPNSLAVNEWVGTLQYVPAVAGGIFGLLGGYLTDLLGRRRVLVWSIMLYALSALAAGYATTVGWLLFWRCCTFVGVCVEFVAAVAWLSELFPDSRTARARCGLYAGVRFRRRSAGDRRVLLVVTYGASFPDVRGGHEAWRYTLISGLISGNSADDHPAVPARIADLAREEGGRHPSSAQFRRSVYARVPPYDDRDDRDDGMRLRSRVRRDSADAANCSRTARRSRSCRGRRRSRRSAACSRFKSSAVWRDACCWRSSRRSSSAVGSCCGSSRSPG